MAAGWVVTGRVVTGEWWRRVIFVRWTPAQSEPMTGVIMLVTVESGAELIQESVSLVAKPKNRFDAE
jgi:hypothetical protein